MLISSMLRFTNRLRSGPKPSEINVVGQVPRLAVRRGKPCSNGLYWPHLSRRTLTLYDPLGILAGKLALVGKGAGILHTGL